MSAYVRSYIRQVAMTTTWNYSIISLSLGIIKCRKLQANIKG